MATPRQATGTQRVHQCNSHQSCFIPHSFRHNSTSDWAKLLVQGFTSSIPQCKSQLFRWKHIVYPDPEDTITPLTGFSFAHKCQCHEFTHFHLEIS